MRWLCLCNDCGAPVEFGTREARNAAHEEKYEGVACGECAGTCLCACRDCVRVLFLRGFDTEAA